MFESYNLPPVSQFSYFLKNSSKVSYTTLQGTTCTVIVCCYRQLEAGRRCHQLNRSPSDQRKHTQAKKMDTNGPFREPNSPGRHSPTTCKPVDHSPNSSVKLENNSKFDKVPEWQKVSTYDNEVHDEDSEIGDDDAKLHRSTADLAIRGAHQVTVRLRSRRP